MYSPDMPDPADALARGRHRFAAAALLIALSVGAWRLFSMLWHRDALEAITGQPGGWAGAVLVVAGSAVLHELLHAFGWIIFARLPWRAIAVRPTWRVMGFAAHPAVAMPVSAFRAGLSLPTVMLGGGAITLGCATGIGLYVLWAPFFLLECFSDLALLLALRKVPARTRVIPHPKKLGCRRVATAQNA